MEETKRRRQKQLAFNQTHGIVPQGVVKAVRDMIDGAVSAKTVAERRAVEQASVEGLEELSEKALSKEIARLEKQMLEHARNLEFEQAARARDALSQLKARVFGAGQLYDQVQDPDVSHQPGPTSRAA
jgi:excinuclease ABC subunit B